MSGTIVFALICGVAGVLYALMTAGWVTKQDAGNEKMQEISNAVKEGATAFLTREYKTVAYVAAPLFVLLFFLGKWIQYAQMYVRHRLHTAAFSQRLQLPLKAAQLPV